MSFSNPKRDQPSRSRAIGSRQEAERQEAQTLGNILGSGFGNLIDSITPNFRTADSLGQPLVRRTPIIMAICIILLVLCIVASRNSFIFPSALWIIPALGTIGISIGLWIWSSSLLLQRSIVGELREALKKAIRLQLGTTGIGLLVIVYFIGVALGKW